MKYAQLREILDSHDRVNAKTQMAALFSLEISVVFRLLKTLDSIDTQIARKLFCC
jgi:hypothetical protein